MADRDRNMSGYGGRSDELGVGMGVEDTRGKEGSFEVGVEGGKGRFG